jgi:hypothetical protein
MTLSPTAVHETLDRRGLLEQSHGPGTYGLRVHVPGGKAHVAEAFREVVDVPPPDKYLDKLAAADDVAYVGASGDVYARLMDHAESDVRQSLFLQAFEVAKLIDVWPSPAPFENEFNRARTLSDNGWGAVWTDGEVV